MGSIVQVDISPGGLPKTAIELGHVTALGIEGDLHNHPQFHGGPRKAILIIASEVVDELARRGYPVFYGALGENLTTRGFDVRGVRIGDTIRAGGAVLEVTAARVPCSQGSRVARCCTATPTRARCSRRASSRLASR